jgi:hypothetical protein
MDEAEPFEKQWNERPGGLESLFGKADEMVLHGVILFQMGTEMGGTPDVLSFSSYVDGKLHVTCELVGSEEQKPNNHGRWIRTSRLSWDSKRQPLAGRRQLVASNGHLGRRFDAQTNGPAPDPYDRHADLVADKDGLAWLAGENEHPVPP